MTIVMRRILYWLRLHFRRESLAVIKEWWHGYPGDYPYLLRLERAKLQEMIAYHRSIQRFEGWEYYVRDMKICMALIGIMLEEKDLFHFDGKLEFVPIKNNDELYEVKGSDNFRYVCDVYVNTRNAGRFAVDEARKKVLCEYPSELYLQKARRLYHKIRYEHEFEWWE